MIWLLALFAGFGLWRVTMVLRRGATDMSTGAILVVIGPLMAAPLVLLAWLGAGRDVYVPVEQAMFAGALGAMCVVLGVVLLGTGKKPAGSVEPDL